jgi:hypothetical protein
VKTMRTYPGPGMRPARDVREALLAERGDDV